MINTHIHGRYCISVCRTLGEDVVSKEAVSTDVVFNKLDHMHGAHSEIQIHEKNSNFIMRETIA